MGSPCPSNGLSINRLLFGIAEGVLFMSHLLSCDLPKSKRCAVLRSAGRRNEKTIAGQRFAGVSGPPGALMIEAMIQVLESRFASSHGSGPAANPHKVEIRPWVFAVRPGIQTLEWNRGMIHNLEWPV
jgi:hypothetical protein